MDLRSQPPHRRKRLILDRESQPRRKSHRSQYSKMIFHKSSLWFPNSPDHAFIEILAPAHKIDDLPTLRIHQQRINCEIPPQNIFGCIRFKHNPIRMSRVGIGAFAPERRHLHRRIPTLHQHHAEMRPYQIRAGKQPRHLLRTRVRDDVEILAADVRATGRARTLRRRMPAIPVPAIVRRFREPGGDLADR